jgi:hypothetical protein
MLSTTPYAHGFDLCSFPSQSPAAKLRRFNKLKRACDAFLKEKNKQLTDLRYWITFINRHHLHSKMARLLKDQTLSDYKADTILAYCYSKDYLTLFKTFLVYGLLPQSSTKQLLAHSQNQRAGAYIQAIFDYSRYPTLEYDEHRQYNTLIDPSYQSRPHKQSPTSLKKLCVSTVVTNLEQNPKKYPLSTAFKLIPRELCDTVLEQCLLQISLRTLVEQITHAKKSLSNARYCQLKTSLQRIYSTLHARKFNIDRYYSDCEPEATPFALVIKNAKKLIL